MVGSIVGMTAAIYIRVSTSKKTAEGDYKQNSRMQLEPLLKMAKERDWQTHVYEDRMSGATSNRPRYNNLIQDARRGRFQVVLVWKFDRFARSLRDLILALDEFKALGIRFVSYTEALDTDTPLGRMMFNVIGSLAEFERDLLIERVNAGIEHAREYGTKSGKAIGRPKVIVRRDEIRRMKDAGVPVREICRKFGIGMSVLYQACSETRQSKASHARRPGET